MDFKRLMKGEALDEAESALEREMDEKESIRDGWLGW